MPGNGPQFLPPRGAWSWIVEFLKECRRLFANVTRSWRYAVASVTALVGVAVWLGYTIAPTQVSLTVFGKTFARDTNVGGLVLGLALVVVILVAIWLTGYAAGRVSGPLLQMGAALTVDTQHRHFRLPIRAVGGIPRVSVVRVYDAAGIDLHTAGPFQLHWSHQPQGALSRDLSWGDDESVGVASASSRGDAETFIRFEGLLYKADVQTQFKDGTHRSVYCRVRALLPGWERCLEATFSFEPTGDEPMFHRATAVEAPHWVRPK